MLHLSVIYNCNNYDCKTFIVQATGLYKSTSNEIVPVASHYIWQLLQISLNIFLHCRQLISWQNEARVFITGFLILLSVIFTSWAKAYITVHQCTIRGLPWGVLHPHPHKYIFIGVCMCVCVREREIERFRLGYIISES